MYKLPTTCDVCGTQCVRNVCIPCDLKFKILGININYTVRDNLNLSSLVGYWGGVSVIGNCLVITIPFGSSALQYMNMIVKDSENAKDSYHTWDTLLTLLK